MHLNKLTWEESRDAERIRVFFKVHKGLRDANEPSSVQIRRKTWANAVRRALAIRHDPASHRFVRTDGLRQKQLHHCVWTGNPADGDGNRPGKFSRRRRHHHTRRLPPRDVLPARGHARILQLQRGRKPRVSRHPRGPNQVGWRHPEGKSPHLGRGRGLAKRLTRSDFCVESHRCPTAKWPIGAVFEARERNLEAERLVLLYWRKNPCFCSPTNSVDNRFRARFSSFDLIEQLLRRSFGHLSHRKPMGFQSFVFYI